MSEFDDTMAFLKDHGKDIGKLHASGDMCASRVIDLYVMMYNHPDPATMGLLIGAVEELKRLHFTREWLHHD